MVTLTFGPRDRSRGKRTRLPRLGGTTAFLDLRAGLRFIRKVSHNRGDYESRYGKTSVPRRLSLRNSVDSAPLRHLYNLKLSVTITCKDDAEAQRARSRAEERKTDFSLSSEVLAKGARVKKCGRN